MKQLLLIIALLSYSCNESKPEKFKLTVTELKKGNTVVAYYNIQGSKLFLKSLDESNPTDSLVLALETIHNKKFTQVVPLVIEKP